MISLWPSCIVRTICGQLVTSCLHLGVSSPPPIPPPCNAGLKLMHTFEKLSERPKIKQETTSKVNCISFNRLLSPFLLNNSSLVRAKAGNFNLKFLNRCFSNYYQVRTWLVFAETVTFLIPLILIIKRCTFSCLAAFYTICCYMCMLYVHMCICMHVYKNIRVGSQYTHVSGIWIRCMIILS